MGIVCFGCGKDVSVNRAMESELDSVYVYECKACFKRDEKEASGEDDEEESEEETGVEEESPVRVASSVPPKKNSGGVNWTLMVFVFICLVLVGLWLAGMISF